jgi:hypothetical protein
MICEERNDLLEKYREEVREYCRVVTRLRDHVRAIPHVEFMLLWDLADRIRRRCEATHRTLNQHVRHHGC